MRETNYIKSGAAQIHRDAVQDRKKKKQILKIPKKKMSQLRSKFSSFCFKIDEKKSHSRRIQDCNFFLRPLSSTRAQINCVDARARVIGRRLAVTRPTRAF